MSKVSIGEKVDKVADDEGDTIIAVFPTADGNFRYVKDMKEYDAHAQPQRADIRRGDQPKPIAGSGMPIINSQG
jgi:hypothetical protein